MHKKSYASIALALLMTGGVSAALAASNGATEASALDSVTVSISDAIAAVEAKGTGKVVEAVLMSEGTVAVYEITTLMADGTETNYAVDAKTGDVVATVDAQQDEPGGQDSENGEDGDQDAQSHGQVSEGDAETSGSVAQ